MPLGPRLQGGRPVDASQVVQGRKQSSFSTAIRTAQNGVVTIELKAQTLVPRPEVILDFERMQFGSFDHLLLPVASVELWHGARLENRRYSTPLSIRKVSLDSTRPLADRSAEKPVRSISSCHAIVLLCSW